MRSVAKIAAGGCALRVSWNQTEHFGRGRRETLPYAQLFGNNGVSFWLFQLFPAEKPGGFPSPESGTGCIGSSTALSEQPPRGTDRRDRALRSPEGRPKGTHSQRPKRFPLRPLGHLGRGVPSAPAGSSHLRSRSEGLPPPTGPPLPSLRRFIRGRRAGSELRHQISQVKWLRSSST